MGIVDFILAEDDAPSKAAPFCGTRKHFNECKSIILCLAHTFNIGTSTANNDQEEGARKNSLSYVDYTGMSYKFKLPRLNFLPRTRKMPPHRSSMQKI